MSALPTVVDRLRRHAQQQPDAIAFRFLADGERETEAITFAALDHRARCIAAQLQSAGVAGARALLLLPQDLRFIGGFFGCLYAGAVAVPMVVPRSGRPVASLLAIARNAMPRAVLTTRDIRAYLEPQLALEFPDLAWLCLEDMAGEPASRIEPCSEGPAFLQYTSGSTGAPKGVMVSHANLAHNAEVMRQALSVDAGSVYGGWLPTYHDMGLIGMVLGPVCFGLPCILMPPLAFLQKPVRWLKLVSNYRVTISGGPNFAFDLCVDRVSDTQASGLDLRSWRIAFNGSEPVRADTISRFNRRFAPHGLDANAMYPCYGMAEATLFVSGPGCGSPVALHQAAAMPQDGAQAVGCGKAWNGMRIAIVDPATCLPLPAGETGEIWIAGDSVALGYFGRTDLTQEVFRARLAGGSADFHLRSGDLGFMLDGALSITGRLKDMIIIRGRNYYPQDIEATAQAHPHLQQGGGAAFAVESAGEERLVLVQELKRASLQADCRAIARDLQEAIAAEHGLSVHEIVLVKPATVPKTSSGKLRRIACRDLLLQNELDAVYRHANPMSAARDRIDPVPRVDAA